ncbi:hypothetical protein F5B18DRAFT_617685 [Nemania serpens]|nr:hypothetical protein F5B18DRAFT_617685 [Nemania serpens]
MASPRFLALGLALIVFLRLVSGAAVPHYFRPPGTARHNLSVQQIIADLGPQLSNGSLLFGPSDSRWVEATHRYNTLAVPHVEVLVEPAHESDISTIVKFCNANGINFMAVNRAHSYTLGAGTFNGLQISMSKLRNIQIRPGGKTAVFQGGTYDYEVNEFLWDRGFVGTTGACDCVGMMGPGLGGGHGRYEGIHGLIGDNLVDMNVVLADGSAIKVNDKTHADLFWGMRGAGHNFGIVTSFEMKIYPKILETWHYHNYYWTADKLEGVFKALNKFHNNGNTPVLMAVNYGGYWWNPNVTDTEASIYWVFGYAGDAADAEKLLEPFNKIPAALSEQGDVPYPELATVQGTGLDGTLCVPNQKHIVATAGLQSYNIKNERKIYNTFNRMVAKHPELKTAHIVHEGYSNEAVRRVASDSTAFPFRDDYLLMFFDTVIPDDGNLTKVTKSWAAEVRDLWNEGQPGRKPSNYVNYAAGDEPVDSMYGYEPWRQEKLLHLKAKYDPHNKFRYYNPLIREY